MELLEIIMNEWMFNDTLERQCYRLLSQAD